jgi:hypothetical protein
MTLIAFQDGKPVFRDGKVGAEQECCCEEECCLPCPENFADLCFDITLTDHDGNVKNFTQADFLFGIMAVQWTFPNGTTLSLFIDGCFVDCADGGISVSASGSVGGFPGCPCTGASGGAVLDCSTQENWHIGTISGNIVLEDTAGCGDCPNFANAGSFNVTISEPPC